MSRFVKTEHGNILRDTESTALLNNDVVAFQTFKEQRAKAMQVDTVSQEVDTLKAELMEIKELLKEVVGRRNND